MGNLSAHHAAVRTYCYNRKSAAFVDAEVCIIVSLVHLLQTFLVTVKAVAVFHCELTDSDQACSGTGVVTPLCLNLENQQRKTLVGINYASSKVCTALFMSHCKTHVAVLAVFEAGHFAVNTVETACLLPDIAGVYHRHKNFLGSNALHLLANNGFNLLYRSEAKRQKGKDTGSILLNKTGSKQVFIAFAVRTVGCFPQSFGKQLAHPHEDNLLISVKNQFQSE